MSDNSEFLGRTALVTGASRNLGAEIARLLAARGAKVAINCRRSTDEAKKVLDGLAGSGHILAVGDVGTSQGVESVVSAVERSTGEVVDIVVNNAGPFSMTPYLQLDPDEFDAIWASNTRSVYLVARRVAPGMSAKGWGRIINVSAGSAFARNHSVYSLAKEGVIMLTEQLAVELGPAITVNCVAPGQIAESADEMAAIDPGFVASVLARTPTGRLITRPEVAGIVVALCSAMFDMVTGVTIAADGGARLPVV
jgi:NAD(P)-dependent dehydrogenase (short-subunit alcohol dehydrogenase family)